MTIYPKVAEINCETGETIVREQNPDEKSEYDAAQLEQSALVISAKALADTKASAISGLVAGRPLTKEEAATVVI